MTEDQAKMMLSDLVERLDYDVYKDLFHYNQDDDMIEDLVEIVQRHVELAKS